MKDFAKALAALQAEIGAAHKSSTNPHYKSKYADLVEVWETWREVGPKHGFALLQSTKTLDNGLPALVTILLHESGDMITGEYPLIPTKQDPQGFGSAMSYARRYCLAAMVGIVQDDDDGNAASEKPKPKDKPTVGQKNESTLTPEQKAIAWLETARERVKTFTAQVEYKMWKAENEKFLTYIEKNFPDKYEAFTVYVDGLWNNWAEDF